MRAMVPSSRRLHTHGPLVVEALQFVTFFMYPQRMHAIARLVSEPVANGDERSLSAPPTKKSWLVRRMYVSTGTKYRGVVNCNLKNPTNTRNNPVHQPTFFGDDERANALKRAPTPTTLDSRLECISLEATEVERSENDEFDSSSHDVHLGFFSRSPPCFSQRRHDFDQLWRGMPALLFGKSRLTHSIGD